jgi:serine-type D-Ala-D-Ala endopeptidase (penicillin-binding protein 7)
MKKILLTILIATFAFVNTADAKTHKKEKKSSYVVKKQKKTAKRKAYKSSNYVGCCHTNPNILFVNLTDNSIIDGNYSANKVSIASLSKLMTVYTVVKNHQNFNEVLQVNTRLSNHTRLSKGMTLTRGDLVKLALVHSDNLAAQTLAESFPGGFDAFIYEMNKNAKELGMNNTVFFEPTGLNANNSSTIQDILLLTRAASQYETFREAAKSENVVIKAQRGKKTIKITAGATNKMFGKEGVLTIKTGFTNAAGFCITILMSVDNKLYNLIVLGARSSKERQKIIERSMQSLKYI